MAKTKFLARDLVLQVKIASTYTAVGGLNTLTHSPSTERADTTGFDENGRPTHIVAQRGDSWALAGHALVDVGTGEKDAGQDYIEASAREVGTAAEEQYRITDPGGNYIEFMATAEVTNPGGGHNDAASWAANIEITGDVTYVPASAS